MPSAEVPGWVGALGDIGDIGDIGAMVLVPPLVLLLLAVKVAAVEELAEELVLALGADEEVVAAVGAAPGHAAFHRATKVRSGVVGVVAVCVCPLSPSPS